MRKVNPIPHLFHLRFHVTGISLAGEAVAASPAEVPEVAATEAAPAQAPAATGDPSLTVINYTPHPLTFTIDNSAYQLVEDGGEANITLAPGKYSFTAATPWAAVNGELELGSGEEMRLSISANVAGSESDELRGVRLQRPFRLHLVQLIWNVEPGFGKKPGSLEYSVYAVPSTFTSWYNRANMAPDG